MKNIVTATIAFLLFAVAVNAQKRKCGNEVNGNKGKHKREVAQKLNMTDAQKEKIKQYNKQYIADLNALEANDKMTLGEYNAKKEALEQKRKDNTKSVLTPEQKKQLETLKAERKQKHTAKQEQKLTKLSEKLKLTDAQVNAVKQNKEKAALQKEAIKNDNSLTKEAKKEKLKALKESNKVAFQNSLTAEQKLQLEELKKNKKGKRAISK